MATHYFGAYLDPYHAADWVTEVGVKPDVIGFFEHWYRQRMLTEQFAKVRALGIERMMITWEPWEPAPVGSTPEQQGAAQAQWSNESIARGDHDTYIRAFADSIKASGLSMVYIRLMHEMNGGWYPWSNDPEAYVAAWKRIVLQFKKRNVTNVRWVFAPNPSLYQDNPRWLRDVLPYWPGATQVDFFGSTAINYGGEKNYTVFQFAKRFDLAGAVFGKPIAIAELNVAYDLREQWLTNLCQYVGGVDQPVHIAMLSQGQSRAAANGSTGDLSWLVEDDALAQGLIQRLWHSLHFYDNR